MTKNNPVFECCVVCVPSTEVPALSPASRSGAPVPSSPPRSPSLRSFLSFFASVFLLSSLPMSSSPPVRRSVPAGPSSVSAFGTSRNPYNRFQVKDLQFKDKARHLRTYKKAMKKEGMEAGKGVARKRSRDDGSWPNSESQPQAAAAPDQPKVKEGGLKKGQSLEGLERHPPQEGGGKRRKTGAGAEEASSFAGGYQRRQEGGGRGGGGQQQRQGQGQGQGSVFGGRGSSVSQKGYVKVDRFKDAKAVAAKSRELKDREIEGFKDKAREREKAAKRRREDAREMGKRSKGKGQVLMKNVIGNLLDKVRVGTDRPCDSFSSSFQALSLTRTPRPFVRTVNYSFFFQIKRDTKPNAEPRR